MRCPKCGNENVNITAVTETKTKTRWGCGCLITWLAFLFPKHKSKTHTEAVCQNCGNRWKVSASEVRRNASTGTSSSTSTLTPDVSDSTSTTAATSEPFYKSIWFVVVCGVLFPPLGIGVVWLLFKDEWSMRKKIIATAIMAVWFIIVFCVPGGSDSSTPSVPSSSDKQITSSVISSEYVSGGDLAQTKALALSTDKVINDNVLAAEAEYNKMLNEMSNLEGVTDFSGISQTIQNVMESMDTRTDTVKALTDVNAQEYIDSAVAYFAKIKSVANYTLAYINTYDESYIAYATNESSTYNNVLIPVVTNRFSYLASAGYTPEEINNIIG